MLEPFLMLTVLNCFFMFSSTVTTCALWWQTRRHRYSCNSPVDKPTKLNDHLGSKSSVKKREKLDSKAAKESKRNKKAKSSRIPVKPISEEEMDETPKTLEKLMSTEEKDETPKTLEKLMSTEERDETPKTLEKLTSTEEKDETPKTLEKLTSTEEKDKTPKTLEKLTSTEEPRQGATSPSSDAKSTIVMEVSTVQKVVQIIEHERDDQQCHLPKGTLTCRFSPESDRKLKFLVRSGSEERSKTDGRQWS